MFTAPLESLHCKILLIKDNPDVRVIVIATTCSSYWILVPNSDYHICGGGNPSPDPHFPADQNPHSHRPHPGVQQVSPDATQ